MTEVRDKTRCSTLKGHGEKRFSHAELELLTISDRLFGMYWHSQTDFNILHCCDL